MASARLASLMRVGGCGSVTYWSLETQAASSRLMLLPRLEGSLELLDRGGGEGREESMPRKYEGSMVKVRGKSVEVEARIWE